MADKWLIHFLPIPRTPIWYVTQKIWKTLKKSKRLVKKEDIVSTQMKKKMQKKQKDLSKERILFLHKRKNN